MIKEIRQLAWKRFNIITASIGDIQGRFILTIFYFSILVPFGLLSRRSSASFDKQPTDSWIERDPVASDLESARRQS
ncbi:MAG: hypothetical protein D6737_15885 [Chloroflexi bacterium]|nr:MAG: hypothetical protein D6737_15885 [Chloroflexota bacterium]